MYTLQASTYQMGILLQFNNEDSYTANDLQIITQLTDVTLKGTLLVRLRYCSQNLFFRHWSRLKYSTWILQTTKK
jgi:hypothetical protein